MASLGSDLALPDPRDQRRRRTGFWRHGRIGWPGGFAQAGPMSDHAFLRGLGEVIPQGAGRPWAMCLLCRSFSDAIYSLSGAGPAGGSGATAFAVIAAASASIFAAAAFPSASARRPARPASQGDTGQVAGIGGQQILQYRGAQPEQPGADRPLGHLQASAAGQRCRRGGQPGYLGRRLRREPGGEFPARPPPFCPSGSGAVSPGPANGGRASQIVSFTCSICPVSDRNRSHSPASRSALPSSGPGRGCVVTVLPSAHRVRFHCGPCPGSPGRAHRQFGLPHLRNTALSVGLGGRGHLAMRTVAVAW